MKALCSHEVCMGSIRRCSETFSGEQFVIDYLGMLGSIWVTTYDVWPKYKENVFSNLQNTLVR